MSSHILGYPRIGDKRQLKFALEKYWKGDISLHDLKEAGEELKLNHPALKVQGLIGD